MFGRGGANYEWRCNQVSWNWNSEGLYRHCNSCYVPRNYQVDENGQIPETGAKLCKKWLARQMSEYRRMAPLPHYKTWIGNYRRMLTVGKKSNSAHTRAKKLVETLRRGHPGIVKRKGLSRNFLVAKIRPRNRI